MAAAIYLRNSRQRYVLATSSVSEFAHELDLTQDYIFPIGTNGVFGYLVLVTDGLTLEQQNVLRLLVQNLAPAVQNAALVHQLREARNAQVLLREEERRKLRRNLHNSIGPTLAALNLHVRTVEELVQSDPKRALEELTLIRRMTSAVITDIRRVIYGLRPPALDELGLIEALRAQASVFRSEVLHIDLQLPERIPSLTAASEVAVYRIVQEALANVSSHSRATICIVQLAVENEGLRVTVDDNGIGRVSAIRAGVGMSSMRELAGELEGSCELSDSEIGGLRICAWLPHHSFA